MNKRNEVAIQVETNTKPAALLDGDLNLFNNKNNHSAQIHSENKKVNKKMNWNKTYVARKCQLSLSLYTNTHTHL